MAFAGIQSLTNNVFVDIFSGISGTGVYEVIFSDAANQVYLSSSNAGTGTQGIHLGGTLSLGAPMRFEWDSANPLYLFANGAGLSIKYVVTKKGSVGLAVSC